MNWTIWTGQDGHMNRTGWTHRRYGPMDRTTRALRPYETDNKDLLIGREGLDF
ncbi:hypothetical protein DPMN_118165 [Dreissena polymorpha]|uniref:Uncharacterized protein n=1 Tax=Dreissena polymorpha TaxID=45954 RepID=A0A9D4GKA1_DREPO|nr:hypothetical protein DPMN_118165 [Dreissena polymorpha]